MSKLKEKKKFMCMTCGAQLSSSYNLKVHVDSNCSTLKKFKCKICEANFLTSHSLKSHINTIHSDEKKFVCSHCAKAFASKGQLVVHERSHTKDKPFKCNECGKSFAYRESLVTHSTTHTNLKPYACANCQKTFSCIGNLIKHRKVRLDTCGREEFKIQKVNKRARVKVDKNVATVTIPQDEMIIEDPIIYQEIITYNTNNEIDVENSYAIVIPTESIEVKVEGPMQAMDIIENEYVEDQSIENELGDQNSIDEDEVPIDTFENTSIEDEELCEYMEINDKYCCKLCPKIYLKKIMSIKHLKKEHDVIIKTFNYDNSNRYRKPQRDQSFTCRYCPKKFTSSKMRERHEIVHGPNGNLIYKCSCCSQWFENFTELEVHQNSNHKDRLKCNDCMRKFDHPEKLLSHKKYAHSGKNAVTKKYVFVCTLCGRSFNTRVALSDHERSNCGKNPIYTCKYCDKKYHSAGSLKCHTTIHTLELNFACDHCPKKFRTKGQLVIHQRCHTKDKPFKCNFPDCTASFSHRESLLTHHTTHTGIKRFQCEQCCAQFSCISNLLAHRRSKKQKGCGESTKIQKIENALTTLSSIDSFIEKE